MKDLQPGDKARTLYPHYRGTRFSEVTIVERCENQPSQSGVLYRVSPALPTSDDPDDWFDASWFHPLAGDLP